MKYSQVIAEAWQTTTENKRLKWFAFVPSFVGVLVFMFEVLWQYFFLAEEFGQVEDGFFFGKVGSILKTIAEQNLIGIGISFLVVILIFYFFLPAWVHSTLILGVRHKYNHPEKKFSLRQKIIDGFKYFFQIFEFRAAMSPFELTTIGLATATFYRYYHGEVFDFLFPFIIGFSILSLIIGVLTIFTPFFIICEGKSFSESVKASIALAFLHLGTTIGLSLLVLLINIRIIVNVIVIFGVPALLFGLISYFTDSGLLGIFLTLGIIVGLGLVGLAAYLTAIIEVFSVSFWERSFNYLRNEQKQIEEEV